MQRYSAIIATALLLAAATPTLAQRISNTHKPAANEYTTLLMPMDGSAKASVGKSPTITGKLGFVAGKFDKAAVPASAKMIVSRSSAVNPNRGTIEFFMKADSLKWFNTNHTLIGNAPPAGKPGTMHLWYWIWSGRGHMRFDLPCFLPANQAYIIFPYPQDTRWHHVAATWDNTWGIAIYIDGNRVMHKTAKWKPLQQSPAELALFPNLPGVAIDELRISNAPLPGSTQQCISWQVAHGAAAIKTGKTHMPITVTLTNNASIPMKLSGTLAVTGYYQNRLAEVKLNEKLPANATRKYVLDVVTDNAGEYVKVSINANEGETGQSVLIDDEQIVFADVITGKRMRLSLNGKWEMTAGNPLNITPPPSAAKWTKCELPYRWMTWRGTHTRWFRKRFRIPQQMADKTLELQLSGVRFRADVYLNGEFVRGGHTDQMPFPVDLTRDAKFGEENELLLAVTDWVSCVAPEAMAEHLPTWASAWFQGREIRGMPFIRLATCGVGGAGISDPISIIARPRGAIVNSYVTPSVRKSELAVKTVLENKQSQPRQATLRASVIDGDKVVAIAETKQITLSPGRTTQTRKFPVDLSKITLWWPKKPKLYRLRIELMDGKNVLDRFDTRFGFREFWADGPVFRMNGVAMRPRASAPIPTDVPGLCNYDAKSSIATWYACKKYLRSFFDINVNMVRYHTEPYPILMMDQADELGLMIVTEAWMATLPGKMKLTDDRTWRNMETFYRKWVRREFNHPAMVIRSMENELGYHLPAKDAPRSPWGYSHETVEMIIRKMRNMGRLVKSLDPSRPIMYHGSGPLFYDVADIYNLHYPGIPGGGDLYPITGRRMSIPMNSYREKNWLWDKAKPLFIGEYDSCFGRPAGFGTLMGEDAYVNHYLTPAHLAQWAITVPGHRIDDVTAGVPWTALTFNGHLPVLNPNTNAKLRLYKELFSPIATFIHQYRICYFENRKTIRTVTTLNDTLKTQAITLRWALNYTDGKSAQSGKQTMSLAPATSKRTQLHIKLPPVSKRTELKLIVDTIAGGKRTHRDTREFVVYPDKITPHATASRIGTIGVDGQVLSSLGVQAVKLSARRPDLSKIDVLFVANNVKGLKPWKKVIDKFLRDGGRIVLLGGPTAPDFLPVQLRMAKVSGKVTYRSDTEPGKMVTITSPGSATTMTHPRMPEHPLLKGLGKSQLRFWREDHLACEYTYIKPERFSAWGVIDCGPGLKRSALLEIPHGRGRILAVQLPMFETFSDQPAARILLNNVLDYVDDAPKPAAPTAIGFLGDAQSPIVSSLKAAGVEPYLLSGKLKSIKSFAPYAAIIVAPGKPALAELSASSQQVKDYVHKGGVIWFHGPRQPHAAAINAMLPTPITIHNYTLTAPIRVNRRGLLAGVTSDELFWPEGSFLPPAAKRVAKYTIAATGPGVAELTRPAVAVSVADGKGHWLFDEVTWDTEYAERSRGLTFLRGILTNLGAQIRGGAKMKNVRYDPSLGMKPVDISKHCNEGFTGGIWNGPTMGIYGLPMGKQVFRNVLCEIIDPKSNDGKACVGFYSNGHNKTGVKSITVPIGRRAAAIHLISNGVYTSQLDGGAKILDISIEYTDGTSRQTQLDAGSHILDWCIVPSRAAEFHPATVWIGKKWPKPGLYDFEWINPEPNKTIKRIKLSAANDRGYVALFAVTTQARLSKKQKTAAAWIPGQER